MRAAVIFGLGSGEKDLKPFQEGSDATWLIGLPASSSEADAILVFGGDGTVHRHLAQLVKLQLPVLVVPCGSGNDFARALDLGSITNSFAAWRKFSANGGNTRAIDLGVIAPMPDRSTSASEVPSPHVHYFCGIGGVGLDAEVACRANRLPRWLRAHGGYIVSLSAALFRFATIPVNIGVPSTVNPGKWATRSNKLTVLAAFANAPTYGGGMRIAPRAQLDDGQLDVCVISDINKFKLFCLFPTVYFGRHLDMTEVEYFQAQHLRIETERPVDVYADGEYVCRTPIDVSVARGVLPVIVP